MNQAEGNPVLPAIASGSLAPLISLLVTSWNTDQQLARFLKSLEVQGKSLENIEVIFIGDDSMCTGLQLASHGLVSRATTDQVSEFSTQSRNF